MVALVSAVSTGSGCGGAQGGDTEGEPSSSVSSFDMMLETGTGEPSDPVFDMMPDPDLGDPQLPELTASPPGATFVGEIEVSLEATDPEVEIWYTDDASPPVLGASLPYVGPITLTESTTLRAIAQLDNGAVVATAPTFVRIAPELDGFSSELPLMIAWSRDVAPVDKTGIYTDFTLSIFEPELDGESTWPADADLSVRAGVRVRGSSSAMFPKKPYRVETWDPADPLDVDMDVTPLGLPPEADWVLIAPLRFDRGLIRNALNYRLSNEVGRYAPRTRFVELFVGELGEELGMDDYAGIYLLAEKIERDASRVPLVALQPTDLTEPAVTGGYIFKEDRLGVDEVGFLAGTAGGAFSFQHPFVWVEPDEVAVQPEQIDWLRAYVDHFGETLIAPSFTHPQSQLHYSEIIDVDSFIDFHILNVLAKNPDAFRLSGYYHKDRTGLLHAGPIWDFDRTMGCATDIRCDMATWWDASNQTSDCTFVFEHGFWLGLFADPAFRELYWDRWAELLDTELSIDAIQSIIDEMEEELAEAAPRNYARWSEYPPRGGSFESEIALLRDWLDERHAWMLQCLDLPDPQGCIGN